LNADRINARLRLTLRAEKAFGLSSLPVVIERTFATPAPAVTPARAQAIAPRPPAAASGSASSFAPSRRQPAVPVALPVQPDPAPVTVQMPTEPFTAPVMQRAQKIAALRALDETQVKGCTKCRLCETRTQTVFGEGDADAQLMFIGEGPGENEDLHGRPFVGEAGQLLDKMILAMGFSRQQVFICNIVKCRPPNNRQPAASETAACTPYLLKQIEIVRPRVIVTLGLPSTQLLLQTKNSMTKSRGRWHEWRGIKVMPTYHPAYVLRAYTRDTREAVWSDLQQVLSALGLTIPKRKSE